MLGGIVKERVLMHKKTGNLVVLTKKFNDGLPTGFVFLDYSGFYIAEWLDDDFEDLGEL